MDSGYSGYTGRVLEIIQKHGLQVGDRISARNDRLSLSGILMPRSELDDDWHIIVKLDDGYNVGISIESLSIRKLAAEPRPPQQPPFEIRSAPGLPKVAIISTGGTIASRVDYRTGAVSPALTAEDLYQSVPELGEIAEIRTEILLSMFSENLSPEHWVSMAEAASRRIKEGVDGVVITHGTDTLGYTAAALSFALRNLPVPVILVGSQRSSDRPSSDAHLNLKGAVLAAARAPFAEVGVLMHGESSDARLLIHRGTRVRKLHTSRRDAFASVNALPLAEVSDGDLRILGGYRCRRPAAASAPAPVPVPVPELDLKARFDEDVVLIKAFPGIPPDIFDPIIHRDFHGIVLEGTGLGHVPDRLFPQVRRAVKSGLIVVMTSQCINGRVNMNVYSTGRELLSMGVVPAGDMLPETALVKLMWALGQTSDREEARRLFLTNIAGEISERTEYLGMQGGCPR